MRCLLQYVNYLTAKHVLDLVQVMSHYVDLSEHLTYPGFLLRGKYAEPLPNLFSVVVVGQVVDYDYMLADVLISWSEPWFVFPQPPPHPSWNLVL